MGNLVALIESIVDKAFKVRKIKDGRCQIDVSQEKEPKLILRFCPKRPNFGSTAKNEVSSPDFLFVSDHPMPNGRLFVIEMSGGRDKSRNDIERQLKSGFAQLRHRMESKGITSFGSEPLIRAVYYGKMNTYTRDAIAKRPIRFRVFDRSFDLVLLHEGSKLDKVN